MRNSATTAQTPKNGNYGITAKQALNINKTINTLKDPNTTGAQRLSNIISTIMSWGGEAAKDTIQQT